MYLGYIITLQGTDKYRWPQTEEQVKHQVGLLNDAFNVGYREGYTEALYINETS